MQAHMTKQRAVRGLTVALAVILIGAALGVYWYTGGRLELSGTVRDASVTVSSVSAGRVSGVAVNRGDRVARGQVLIRLDETARRAALAAAQEQLTLYAQMLPPQYRPAPVAGDGTDRGAETLDQLHERRLRDEDSARLRLQTASDREAEVSVYYSRVAMMAARREASEADRAAAEAQLFSARVEKERAKAEFEALSLSRAASGADIRRVNEAQRVSGAAALPVDVRLDRYRQQEQRVYLAVLALEEALVKAPDSGVVLGLLAAPGREVVAGAPLVLLQTDAAAVEVVAEAGPGERKQLKTGMSCLVRIDGESADRRGYISAMRPLETADAVFRVVVSLLPENGDDAVFSALGGAGYAGGAGTDATGLEASVTVLLREPLYEGRGNAARLADSGPQAGRRAASPGEAAPPSAPLSVRTPFGDDAPASAPSGDSAEPVSVVDGSRDGAVVPLREAPVLPAMQAPYPLKGSPLPAPGNNPSVAGETVLNNAADAPR